jgi:hypothetical protein
MTRANEDLILIPTTRSSAWILRYDPDIEGARKTVRPEKLLRNDGSIILGKVTSVAVATGPEDVKTLETLYFNVAAFLQSRAIRGTNSIDGIDYCSANSSSICGAQFISVPAMVAEAFPSIARINQWAGTSNFASNPPRCDFCRVSSRPRCDGTVPVVPANGFRTKTELRENHRQSKGA